MRWLAVMVVCGSCGGGHADPGIDAGAGIDADPAIDADPGARCGDGIVQAGEACDTTAAPDACTAAGFYAGTATCGLTCELDLGGCSGRCGDGIVQAASGEACDGLDPAAGTCVTHGLDMGALGCSATCAQDVAADCHAFGWRTQLSTTSAVVQADANPRGTIALTAAGDVVVSWDGTVTTLTGYPPASSAVTASPTIFVLSYTDGYATFDGTWHHHAHALALGEHAIAVTSTGILYVGPMAATQIQQIDLQSGTITPLPAETVAPRQLVTVADLLIVNTASLVGIRRWSGTAWETLSPSRVARIQLGGPTTIVSTDACCGQVEHTLYTVTDTFTVGTTLSNLTDTSEVALGDGVVLSRTGSAVRYHLGLVAVAAETGLDASASALVRSADGSVLALGNGVQRFEPQPMRTQLAPMVTGVTRVVAPLMGFCGDRVGGIVAANAFVRPATPGTCKALLGTPALAHYVASATGVWRWDPPAQAYVQELVDPATQLTGSTNAPIALAAGKVHARAPAGAWNELPLPVGCTAVDVAGTDTETDVLARCGAETRVLAWAGAAFVTRATTTTAHDTLAIGPDGALYVAGGTLRRVEAASFGPVLHTGPLSSVTVLGADDVLALDDDAHDLLHLRAGVTFHIRSAGGPFAVTANELVTWNPTVNQFELIARMTSRFPTYGL